MSYLKLKMLEEILRIINNQRIIYCLLYICYTRYELLIFIENRFRVSKET